MWKTKFFKTQPEAETWIKTNANKYQADLIFVNNGFAVEYRRLKKI
jgi:hypothetical protein